MFQDQTGKTNLHWAAKDWDSDERKNKYSYIKELLESAKVLGILNELIDQANNKGRTPLNIASKEGDLQTVKLLLKNGAKTDKATNDGITPLMSASSNGNLKKVNVLLQHKADVNLKDKNDT